MADLNTPDFPWTGLYYWEIRDALDRFAQVDLPEHTERSDRDPLNGLKRWVALGAHLDGVRIDHAANEVLWSTAQLRASFIPWGRLIGRPLAPPSPSTGHVLADLTRAVTGTLTVWAADSLAGAPQLDGAPILFELQDGPIAVTDTGTFTVKEEDGGVFAGIVYPWTAFGGISVSQDDAIYIGHGSAMFDRLLWTVNTPPVGESWRVSYEYADGIRDLAPDLVTDNGANISFRVDELLVGALGTLHRMDGAEVTVECLLTGVSETVNVTAWAGFNEITTVGILGQAIVSTNAGDYRVTAPWVAFPATVDGTTGTPDTVPTSGFGLKATGVVSWALPDDDPVDAARRRWVKTTVDGDERFWMRARVISTAGAYGSSTVLGGTGEDAGTIYTVRGAFLQGETTDERVGSSDGTALQVFTLIREPLLVLELVTAGGDTWTPAASFLEAGPADSVFVVREEVDGSHTVRFGDGVRGQIPALGLELRATYRYGGELDGDVGRHELTKDRSGNTVLRNLRNGAPFAGWAALEGSTETGIALLRQEIEAFLPSQNRLLSLSDYEALLPLFRSAAGVQVAARVVAIEEGAGLKTVEAVVVGPGGRVASSADLAELEVWANGVQLGLSREDQRVPANNRLVATAYNPRTVNVVIAMEVLTGHGTAAKASAEAAIAAFLQPDAKRLELQADGSFINGSENQWIMGGEVILEAIKARAAQSVRGFYDQAITTPAADVNLASRELPIPGTITVNVTEVAP